MPRCGLVCEGKADFIVLEHLLNDHFSAAGLEISFRRLQPHSDATGKLIEGGWRQVFQWCLRNTKKQRDALFVNEPLFSISSADPIDAILIHLDADICEELKSSDLESIDAFREMPTQTAEERAYFVRSCLAAWLNTSLDKCTDEKQVLVVPIESTEAWLIARSVEGDVESRRDIIEATCDTLYDHLKLKKPANKRIIKKKPELYKRYIATAGVRSNDAFDKCSSFRDMVSALTNIIQPEAATA